MRFSPPGCSSASGSACPARWSTPPAAPTTRRSCRDGTASGEHLLAGVREVVYRRSIPLATQHLAIVQSPTGERAAVLGAAIMVAREVLSPANVDARVSASSR